MYAYYNPETIKKFYGILQGIDFANLSESRKEDIAAEAEKNRAFFASHSIGLRTLMCFTAEKLITSPQRFGIVTPEERAYFYMRIVDPNFLFLEAYESASKREDIKSMCKGKMHIYDSYLIALEKAYNERFCEFKPEDLWGRESFGK